MRTLTLRKLILKFELHILHRLLKEYIGCLACTLFYEQSSFLWSVSYGNDAMAYVLLAIYIEV